MEYAVCDMQTGQVLDYLPLSVSSITRRIGSMDTVSATLPVPDPSTPDQWTNVVNPSRTLIVPLWDGMPVNGYYVPSIKGLRDPTPSIELASLEGIPSRVNVEDYFPADEDLSVVAATLLAQKVLAGWGFDIVATTTGDLLTAEYSGFESRTVASVLDELYDAGLEWTIRYGWTDDEHTHISKQWELGPKVGIDRPDAVFDQANTEATYELSYTSDTGGVRARAASDGSGSSRLLSEWVEATDLIAAGTPPWEIEKSYTAMTDEDHALRLAQSLLVRSSEGLLTWSLACSPDLAPRPGTDWDIGDTIATDFPPRHGARGLVGTFGVTGWTIDLDNNAPSKVTPILAEVDDE